MSDDRYWMLCFWKGCEAGYDAGSVHGGRDPDKPPGWLFLDVWSSESPSDWSFNIALCPDHAVAFLELVKPWPKPPPAGV